MSDKPTPADLADYDQVHANTTQYLGVLVETLRDVIDQGIPRHEAVLALYGQILDPAPDTDPRGRFDHADVAQMLAVAVDRLEPGWPA
jgi:hypothetical protein